jgi:hypothetical protein
VPTEDRKVKLKSAMSQNSFDPCRIAVDRYKNYAIWRNLWTILLFFFGATIIVFTCISILLFINQDWLASAISTLGTIVNGASISWVVKRREEAQREEERAYEDQKLVCAGGPTPSSAQAGYQSDVEEEIKKFQKSLRLLGSIR